MSTNKNVLSPLQHVPIADGSGNIAPHPHYSSTTHMDSQTLPTHSVLFLFLFLLIQTIFAMGRCCNLSTRSTRRNPLPIAPTATGLLYTYSTPYPMLTFIYNIYYCPHRHVSLSLPVTVTLVYSVYPLNWSCLYHVFTTECLCIYRYYVHLPNAGCEQHLLFPFPFCTTPLPHPPCLSPPGRPQADGSPLMCRGSAKGSFLINREFFLAPAAIVLALRGSRLWALESALRQLCCYGARSEERRCRGRV